MTDMNTYSTSHYHLMNEHVVDKADTAEQVFVNNHLQPDSFKHCILFNLLCMRQFSNTIVLTNYNERQVYL